MTVLIEKGIAAQLPVDLLEDGTLAEALPVIGMHVLPQQVLGDQVAPVHGLQHGKDIGVFLQLDGERCPRPVQPAGGQMEPLVRALKVGAGKAQDQVVFPFNQVGEQEVLLFFFHDGRVHAKEGLGVFSHVHSLGEVIGLFLGIPPELVHGLLALVDVVREALLVIEYLGKPAQAFMGLCVGGSHDQVPGGVDGGFQGDAVGLQREVAQAFIRGAYAVVGLRSGPDPALADEAPLPERVLAFLQPEPAAWGQKIAGHPGGFQAQDPVARGKSLLDR